MNKLISLALFFLVAMVAQAQDSLEYQFDRARALLAKREIQPAIESLRKIYVERADHANINFLMGAAYTELGRHQKEAIFHLKKAVQNVNETYKVGSFKEAGAPLHVYYYLTVALVEDDRCAAANQAFEKFKAYQEKVDDYFIEEAARHLEKCPFEPSEKGLSWLEVEPAPEGYEPKKLAKQPHEKVDSSVLAERGMLVQRVEFTTNTPLYGVQIASNLNPSPISSYGNIKNIDVFVDNQGFIRYVVGHFSYYSQAEALLKTLQNKGFKDAFIVNVNDERKYPNELISYQNINLRSGIRGNVEFFIQMGAFEEEIPAELMEVYLSVDGVEEIRYDGLTIIAVGPFLDYQRGNEKLMEVKSKGFQDAYMVAFNRGKKIPLKEAINHTQE